MATLEHKILIWNVKNESEDRKKSLLYTSPWAINIIQLSRSILYALWARIYTFHWQIINMHARKYSRMGLYATLKHISFWTSSSAMEIIYPLSSHPFFRWKHHHGLRLIDKIHLRCGKDIVYGCCNHLTNQKHPPYFWLDHFIWGLHDETQKVGHLGTHPVNHCVIQF